MASLRPATRKNGTEHVQVLYRLDGKQTSTSFEDVTDHWKPLVEFLVASGARWSEATALRPPDVNMATNIVRITKVWNGPMTGQATS